MNRNLTPLADAEEHLARCTGDPKRLMTFASEGRFSKDVLANLLRTESRRAYLEACATIEKHFTDQCTAKAEHCLADGCAMDGDVCLDALLKAGPEFCKACAEEWIPLFMNPENRVDEWRG